MLPLPINPTRQGLYTTYLPPDSIRLLRITSDGETCAGLLQQFPITHLPYFAAISWCWTSRSVAAARIFVCNGQDIPITSRLHDLFNALTPTGIPASVAVWIDALCINQDDTREKDVHIPRMRELYGKAHFVVVWLGEEFEESALVMDAVHVQAMQRQLRGVPGYGAPMDLLQYGLPGPEDPMWQAVGRLCDRDWFYRTWVVQEVALARRIEVLCGGQWLAWDTLVGLVSEVVRTGLSALCRASSPVSRTRPNGFRVLLDLAFTRTMHQDGRCPTDYVLRMVRLKEVTKPIDKVYGLLGLLDDGLRGAIHIDYAEYEDRYWTVYLDVAKYVVSSDPSFWLLSMASSTERPKELPSWCPNLNSTIPEILDFSSQRWSAGIIRGKPHGSSISTIPDSSRIKVSGFVVDVVQAVVHLGGPAPPVDEQGGVNPDDVKASFLERNTACSRLSQEAYNGTDMSVDAYSRALVVNTWADGSPVMPLQQDRVSRAYRDTIAYLQTGRLAATDENKGLDVEQREQVMHQYLRQLGWWGQRPFFTTKDTRIGRGPASMRAGDVLCVFYGAGPIFVLRHSDCDLYELVGDAYLHDCMDLESLPPSTRGQDREFVLG
ncbi:hypothetical protein MMC11_001335 [Xylographa trunciseda]|nr:hypothetical protein [Xylographa trunciseda]